MNGLLLLLVGVLGFFALSSKNKNSDEPRLLSSITASSIKNIAIRHNNRVVKIERTGTQWQLTEPIKIAANDFRMGSLLKLLNTPSHAKYDAESLTLEKYGLAKPATSISFNQHRFEFGIHNPINKFRYIKFNNEVHLVDDHFYPLISSQMGTLVARTLLPADSDISQLTLPEQTLSLDSSGKWQSTKDISADAIIETLDHWRGTEAFGVHDYNEVVPLDAIQVTIDDQDKPIVFLITDVDPWLIIARPDIKLEYHFNLEYYDLLLRPGAAKKLPEEFQDRTDSQQTAPLQPL